MKVIRELLLGLGVMLIAGAVNAQCDSWVGNPNQAKIMEAHVLYRGLAKGKDADKMATYDDMNFGIVYDNWKTAYEAAPAADGKRTFHYTDGVNILKAKAKRDGTSEEEKTALNEQILGIWDSYSQCFEDKKAVGMGRKAFDMFYMANHGYRKSTFDAFKTAIEEGGNDVEYIILQPLGQLVNYLFQNDQVTSDEAQDILIKATDIAEYNMENNDKFKTYYEYGLSQMKAAYKDSENDIFDCEYFKGELIPLYEESKDSLEILKYVYLKLVAQGCDTTDTKVLEIKNTYETLAAEINAKLQAEFLANNPGVAANNAYKEDRFDDAIALYKEAIENEEDNVKKGEYWFSIASIQFRKLKQKGVARASARKAIELRPNWGRPYLLIGDMYASSTSCQKEAFFKGVIVLAAINKYAAAKSVDDDPDIAAEANRKIGIYNGSIPLQSEAFLRQMKDGSSIGTGCWIGETVKLRTRRD